ncbi:MAG: hypothetical protein ACOCVF_03995 [bacterium]
MWVYITVFILLVVIVITSRYFIYMIKLKERNKLLYSKIKRLRFIINYCNKNLKENPKSNYHIKLKEKAEEKIDKIKKEIDKPLYF